MTDDYNENEGMDPFFVLFFSIHFWQTKIKKKVKLKKNGKKIYFALVALVYILPNKKIISKKLLWA